MKNKSSSTNELQLGALPINNQYVTTPLKQGEGEEVGRLRTVFHLSCLTPQLIHDVSTGGSVTSCKQHIFHIQEMWSHLSVHLISLIFL